MEDNFSMDQGVWGWFQDYSNTLHLLCTLFLPFLHHLHLRSLGVRYWILGTPALKAHEVQYSHRLGETPPSWLVFLALMCLPCSPKALLFLDKETLLSWLESSIGPSSSVTEKGGARQEAPWWSDLSLHHQT